MVMLGMRQMGLVGSMLAGRYELCAPLASGGMGDVYRGWDHRLCRPVAVKLLRPPAAVADQDEGASEYWWWEAWVMAASRSPHIVKVYDVVKDSECGYVVMELVQGIDLKQYVASAGPLAGSEALHIGIQVCQALRVMHSQHSPLVHWMGDAARFWHRAACAHGEASGDRVRGAGARQRRRSGCSVWHCHVLLARAGTWRAAHGSH